MRPAGSRWAWAFLIDIAVFLSVFAAIYGVYSIGHSWLSPIGRSQISQSPRSFPLYALYSLVRIRVAYALSLFLRWLMATWRRVRGARKLFCSAARYFAVHPGAEFLARRDARDGRDFPASNGRRTRLDPADFHRTGVEHRVQLLFLAENGAARIAGSRDHLPVQRVAEIYELDLPFSTIGLVWNSMMSVAGGWFFLMACEMFVLGDKDFRLPGLGSFLQTAAGNGTRERCCGDSPRWSA